MRSKSNVLLAVIVLFFSVFSAGPALAVDGQPENAASVGAAEGDVRVLEISLADYVDAYTRNSDSVLQAQDRVDNATESFERAVAEKKAALTIEELANAVDTAKLSLREAKNNTAMQAVQTYVSTVQTMRDIERQRANLSVAEERLRVTTLRCEAGLVTTDSLLQQQNSYLSTVDALAKAELNLDQAIESFRQNIGVDPPDDLVLLTDTASLYTGVPEFDSERLLERAQGVSSSYYSALKAEELARKKYQALQDPLIATKVERETAKDALDDAVKSLTDAAKSVSDSVKNALAQLQSLIRALEMQELSTQLSHNSLEIAKIRFDHGEAFAYELESEINSNASSHDRLSKAKEDLYLQILRIKSLAGEEILDLI